MKTYVVMQSIRGFVFNAMVTQDKTQALEFEDYDYIQIWEDGELVDTIGEN